MFSDIQTWPSLLHSFPTSPGRQEGDDKVNGCKQSSIRKIPRAFVVRDNTGPAWARFLVNGNKVRLARACFWVNILSVMLMLHEYIPRDCPVCGHHVMWNQLTQRDCSSKGIIDLSQFALLAWIKCLIGLDWICRIMTNFRELPSDISLEAENGSLQWVHMQTFNVTCPHHFFLCFF